MKTESQMMDHQFSVQSDLQQKSRNTSLIDQNTEMRTCRTKETGQKERRNFRAGYSAAVGEDKEGSINQGRRTRTARNSVKELKISQENTVYVSQSWFFMYSVKYIARKVHENCLFHFFVVKFHIIIQDLCQ